MERKTVFIIGAGASSEVNLPTGEKLKAIISNLLDIRFEYGHTQISGDYSITEALRLFTRYPNGQNGDINPYLYEAWHIRNALPLELSIDNFIDKHRDNEKIAFCGKLAIVKSILEAEKSSVLYFEHTMQDSTINFNALEKTWFLSFFKLVTENCSINQLKARFQSISLIVFNYDRCIEHFLYYAIQKSYKVNEIDAADIVNSISIYHPYGTVGSLPWQKKANPIGFGQIPNSQQLLSLSKEIKTFTEGTNPDSSDIKEIKEHMAKASHLVFLGFAFHKLNMELITPTPQIKNQNIIRCFASAYLISDSNREAITETISRLYSRPPEVNVKMKNIQCSELFNEFWNSLTF
jgi:hypothetical protein